MLPSPVTCATFQVHTQLQGYNGICGMLVSAHALFGLLVMTGVVLSCSMLRCGVVAAGGRGALGKHGRADGGSADGASKRRKGPGGQKLRHAALAAAAATAIPHKHLAVGSRIAVYWRLDKAFYTVSECLANIQSVMCGHG
jgi:hypothetical protein